MMNCDAYKQATKLAKEGNFGDAINLLKCEITNLDKEDSHNSYTKILPYFQKDNRYDESVFYSKNILIPKIKKNVRQKFSHRCQELQKAFINLYISKIYEKLSLCSKREKRFNEEKEFKEAAQKYYLSYEELLLIGNKIELEIEFKRFIVFFGADLSRWPEGLTDRFQSIISKN